MMSRGKCNAKHVVVQKMNARCYDNMTILIDARKLQFEMLLTGAHHSATAWTALSMPSTAIGVGARELCRSYLGIVRCPSGASAKET